MEVVIFIIVLVALIVVHEAGHFAAAKIAGMKVEEFGLGYPPRAALLWKKGDTQYTLNWLPFGGFVRIEGEDAIEGEDGAPAPRSGRSFMDKNRFAQACVLVAGIIMNLLFAYVLLSASLYMGVPRALSADEAGAAPDAVLTVAQVLPGSPADAAGLKEGDQIRQAIRDDQTFSAPDGAAFTSFVAAAADVPVALDIIRDGKEVLLSAKPEAGVIAADPGRPALGVAVVAVGTVREPLLASLKDGAQLTYEVTKETAAGLLHFFAGIFTLSADLSQVAGPVGIAGAVGTAAQSGFASLLSITALISINLALINLLPVPALDGGRLLFVIIEAITRRPIKRSVANAVNGVGFALLVLLMVAVTAHDIFKIVA